MHCDADAIEPMVNTRYQPFQVEARIDIPSYDGSINAKMLHVWLDQLDTYFTLCGYISEDKVMLVYSN